MTKQTFGASLEPPLAFISSLFFSSQPILVLTAIFTFLLTFSTFLAYFLKFKHTLYHTFSTLITLSRSTFSTPSTIYHTFSVSSMFSQIMSISCLFVNLYDPYPIDVTNKQVLNRSYFTYCWFWYNNDDFTFFPHFQSPNHQGPVHSSHVTRDVAQKLTCWDFADAQGDQVSISSTLNIQIFTWMSFRQLLLRTCYM